ncbi:MAG: uroporphyrinogen decarboxylase family protein [Peptococcaceae bacterium]
MTPRERVLAALKREATDRVPWVENYIHTSLINKIIGYQVTPLKGSRIAVEIHEKLCVDNLTYDFRPPDYAVTERHGDLEMIVEGKLRTWEDLKKMQEWLPDPDDESFYCDARELLRQKGDYAAVATIRLGIANVYNSMGYENFIYALYDNPEFITAALEVFADWSGKVIERVNEMDFDIVWISEDIAFQSGPIVTAEQYEKYIFPYAKKLADKIRFPKIYHSDGNYLPVLDYILQYNPSAIANLEPPAMDIFSLKKSHGDKISLLGNIDLHYTLTRGTEEETIAEVKEKIERVGEGGGYLIASSSGLAAYCKPENVLAMNDTILKYGYYK